MSGEASGRSIAVALSVVVAVVVVIGLYLVGSPGAARQQALDERRVNDLREARGQVSAYWRQHGALPGTLDGEPGSSSGYRDPVSGAPYEYHATGDSTWDLCAVFTYPSKVGCGVDSSRHPAGEVLLPQACRTNDVTRSLSSPPCSWPRRPRPLPGEAANPSLDADSVAIDSLYQVFRVAYATLDAAKVDRPLPRRCSLRIWWVSRLCLGDPPIAENFEGFFRAIAADSATWSFASFRAPLPQG